MPATLCVPLRRSRSCPPPTISASIGRALAHREHADALRAAELVGAQRQEVDVRPHVAQVEPAGRLHGVGVEQRARRPLCTSEATGAEVGDRADLVVDGHHADDRRRRRPSAAARASRLHPADGVDGARPSPSRRSTACSTAWCSAAGHTARPPRRRTAPAIAALSASVPHPVNTTSPGPAADHVGDAVAGLVDGPAGVAGEAVRPARVGEALGEERQHRVDRRRAHRRRRRVVEVDEAIGHGVEANGGPTPGRV